MPRTSPISGISYSTGVAMLVWGKDQRLLRVKDLMGSCGWFWVQMHDTSMATCPSHVQGLSWQPRDFLNLHIMTGLCNYLTNPLHPSFFPLSNSAPWDCSTPLNKNLTSPWVWVYLQNPPGLPLFPSTSPRSALPSEQEPTQVRKFLFPPLLPHLYPGFQTYQNLSLLI